MKRFDNRVWNAGQASHGPGIQIHADTPIASLAMAEASQVHRMRQPVRRRTEQVPVPTSPARPMRTETRQLAADVLSGIAAMSCLAIVFGVTIWMMHGLVLRMATFNQWMQLLGG